MRSRSAASSPTSLRSVGGSRRSPAGCRPSRSALSSAPAQGEAQARPDQRVAAEQDRDRGVRGRPRQRPQPRVGDCARGAGGRTRNGPRRTATGRSSAPSRWASSTRLSMIAASPRRARCSPSDDGPSRSRRAPSTLAGGSLARPARAHATLLDERPRARAAPDRSSQRERPRATSGRRRGAPPR